MRIIIESQDGGGPNNASHQPDTVLVQSQDVNAGTPVASLLQTMSGHTAGSNGSVGANASVQGMNAGPPAQWLLDAIALAGSPADNQQDVISDLNAGAAPAL